jgi:antitoxin HicB
MTDSERVSGILARPYSRVLVPDETGGYSARMLEFPGCFAEGETADEALQNLESAAESWLLACLDQDFPIPEPELSFDAPGKVQ